MPNTSDTKKSDNNTNGFSSLNCFGCKPKKKAEEDANQYSKVENNRLDAAGNLIEFNNSDEKKIIDSVNIKGQVFNICNNNKFNSNSPNLIFEKCCENQNKTTKNTKTKENIVKTKDIEIENNENIIKPATVEKIYFKGYPKKVKSTSEQQDTTEIENEILNIKPDCSKLKASSSFKGSQNRNQVINNDNQTDYEQTQLIVNVKTVTSKMMFKKNTEMLNVLFDAQKMETLLAKNIEKRINSGALINSETKSANNNVGNQKKTNIFENSLDGVKQSEIIKEKQFDRANYPKSKIKNARKTDKVLKLKTNRTHGSGNFNQNQSQTSIIATIPITDQLQNVTKELSERFNTVVIDEINILDKKVSAFSMLKEFFKNFFAYNEYDGPEMTWDKYCDLKTIEHFLKQLKKKYSNLVKLETIGKTCHGRSIRSVWISSTYNPSDVIVVEAGIHAREWITPAGATFIINYLVTNWDDLPTHLKNKTWIFFPCVNPDGYHYTWTEERLWRKNRKKRRSECVGIDLNRNFDVGWDLTRRTDPCHINYAGPQPFSERETRAIRSHLLPLSGYIKAYIALHTYGQEIRFRWGLKEEIPYLDRVQEVANLGAKKMSRINNVSYTVATQPNSQIFGTSKDWARKRLGVKYSYLLELRDRGFYGFLLPAQEIIPTAEEAFEFIATVALSIDVDRNYVENKGKQTNNVRLKQFSKRKKNETISNNLKIQGT